MAGATAFQYLSDRPDATAVDISRLDLSGITRENDGAFRIGATTTLTDLVRHRDSGWVLHEVATLIPTHQVRNISTVGGNIARLFPWSELPLGLMVLGAVIVIQGDERYEMSVRELFAKRPSRVLQTGDLIVEVQLPAVAEGQGFGYKKENVSNSAFGLVAAAASVRVEGGRLKGVQIAAGSALPVPTALTTIEEHLEGASADVSVFSAAIQKGAKNLPWKGKEGMSDEFGARLAEVVIQDALEEALQRAKREEA